MLYYIISLYIYIYIYIHTYTYTHTHVPGVALPSLPPPPPFALDLVGLSTALPEIILFIAIIFITAITYSYSYV